MSRSRDTCPECGGPKATAHHRTCRACYRRTVAPARTALRAWMEDFDVSAEELAERCDIPERSMRRYLGGPIRNTDAALRIHEETDIPLETLLRGL